MRRRATDHWVARALLGSLAAAVAALAGAQTPDCIACHERLVEVPVLHAATRGGCDSCHARLDVSAVPHVSRGKAAKGLADEPPELCHTCHEAKALGGLFAHAPVRGGMCMTCHDPHGSANRALTRKPIAALCLDCHSSVTQRPHVIAGLAHKGHPVGVERENRFVADPARPGIAFGCTSCHDPHQSSYQRLNRFDADSPSGFCQRCHRI